MNNEKFLCPHSIVEGKAIADPSRMAGPVLTAVWAHIIHLQSLGDPEERFRFAKWYESETDSYYNAKYDGPPAPKKAPVAAKKARTGGPPLPILGTWIASMRATYVSLLEPWLRRGQNLAMPGSAEALLTHRPRSRTL